MQENISADEKINNKGTDYLFHFLKKSTIFVVEKNENKELQIFFRSEQLSTNKLLGQIASKKDVNQCESVWICVGFFYNLLLTPYNKARV